MTVTSQTLSMDDKKFMQQPAPQAPTTATKLTQWANEPEIRTLKGDFDAAKPAHDAQVRRIQHWNDLAQVTGKAAPPKVKGRSSVQPKLIRRQAEWRYSALTEPFLGSNKLYKVSPVTWEDKQAAEQNELVLNWQWRTKLNRVKFIDDFVRANVDEGTVIVRLGWKRSTVTVKKKVPVFNHFPVQTPEQAQALTAAIQLKAENPRGYAEQADAGMKACVDLFEEQQTATYAVQVGEQVVDTIEVIENRPTAEILNPANFYLDPSCQGDLDKALFAIVSFETNKAELLKEGKKYKNLDAVNWEGNAPITNPDHETSTPTDFNLVDSLRKKVVAYEYWGFCDIHGTGRLVPIVATWIGDVMIRLEENPFPDQKLPFVLVPYLPVKREVMGEPDAELLEDNQKILGAVMRGMIDLLGRSANGQQGFAKGMLDPLNRRRYENGQDYEFNPNLPPQQGLIEHRYPELPQSALMMLNLQNQEAEALTGVKSFGGGISGEAYGDVAAGIRGVLDAASKREMAILRRLAQGMSLIGQKIIAMNAVFMSEQEVVRVTNADYVAMSPAQQENLEGKGDDLFSRVNRQDLVGNFDLEVDISTAEVDNQKSQDLAFMLQTLGPKADWKLVVVILAEICKLKRMPDLAHQLLTFQPTPDPIQQQLAQLEVAIKQKEVEKLDSEIELNRAKAKQASSQADMTDLKYVEQETGTTHARDMQKQAGQSQGNQNLQVTKALTTPIKDGEKRPDITAAVGFNAMSDKLNAHGLPGAGDPVANPAQTGIQRDVMANQDPAYSIHSQHFDPRLDPATNPNLNL